MKQAIIYGGAFNPPTLAHTLILKACGDHAQAINAEIWLLPSGTRTDKTITVDRTTRLLYVDALIADAGLKGVTVRVLTLELDRTVPTETYDTVRELRRLYPEYRQTWVFGADSVVTMRMWHGGDWLARNLPMIIIPRIGTDKTSVPTFRHGSIVPVTTPSVSSTLVRERLAAGQDVSGLVGPRVGALLRPVR